VPSVLVTGASRGFGRELVDEYGRRGWTVFALVRKPEAIRLWDQGAAGWCHPICADGGLASVEEAIGTSLHPLVAGSGTDSVGEESGA
jgi:NAD(P)-dependent dehydrogenase (short-subunit alcohol dehydrogenase family)